MDHRQTAADLQRQIKSLDRSIALWESGSMKAWNDGQDVTAEYLDRLQRNRDELGQALLILERESGS
ncbi:hypothetical protein FSB78_09895 [Sphingomonas ginsenosidivorax]|uniref:Uncharacterized protein n=1 Tax=Sphingomonas ginsenosidivorax TaxID=862135 RepID=A0A5C6UEJ0_9SPHN|nr:hypothetical protein [Sphingomonas ginsenosidivorax]TXC71227.1 hypothetical protein FSB78_09895 [Sphingomonas ginsenosidivorax]